MGGCAMHHDKLASDWISEIGLTLVVSGLAVPVDFYTVYVHAGVRSTHLKRPYSPKNHV